MSETIDKFCAAVETVKAQPTSALGLCVLHDLGERAARTYIRAMRRHGWIEPAGYEPRPQGIRPVIWRWKR